MFCPECGAEYREGFYECSDCQVPLVLEVGPEPTPELPEGDLDLVTVLETGNSAKLLVARSVLESAGIEYVILGESLTVWKGLPWFGKEESARLQVDRSQESAARGLLEEVEIVNESE
jgi:hypothetical protein